MTSSQKLEERPLPAWYYRVNALYTGPDSDFISEDFDEDISDVESFKHGSTNEVAVTAECDCDCEDDDCEHRAEDENGVFDSDDSTSERSYRGPDADRYYELKELREDRKEHLRKLAKEKVDEKDHERRKVEEVRTAYETLKKAQKESETLHMGSLHHKTFRLYCPEHVEHFWTEFSSFKYIEFYYPDSHDDLTRGKKPRTDTRTVEGQICLDSKTDYQFHPFRSPTRPSRKKHALQLYQNDRQLVVQFISDEYVIVRVSRDLVFERNSRPIPESAPKTFKFMGILRTLEKAKAEARERREGRRWV
ncbi:hypothetical protein CGMCC3_g9783 [Colletotrichum fructicola]|uniref:Uncharacterized protein n=1 Tax=Colletotrichum fructicola (strain Nara gc5) TaxID=1213859 RepID=L2FGT3_COLFN|nr:uncharacterized protein CGMCC3_g9783 [Colletotrichum fructicola]KAE9573965.1 hypothetical protein CGMCC3_g9783 [Colletotrichum fructicola]KAF4420896.1 hypothetical protein CFRS1_v004944 [Colletotrichum fructicola]KAF4482458.1 hypothetical protein CGGC5_v009133 [Colletotrichum fructicola Nara gc5]KAF4883658.1 hypothetical protein CGCFRS4_v013386 [Colletotrichum fructicola]